MCIRDSTGTLRLMPEDNEQYVKLKAALDRVLQFINWDEEYFYETVETAYEVLMTELDQMEKHTDVTVSVVGHTHIDVAWLWLSLIHICKILYLWAIIPISSERVSGIFSLNPWAMIASIRFRSV